MRRRIRKFAQNIQTSKQTNTQRFKKQRPPYPLWSVDRRGTRANIISYSSQRIFQKLITEETEEDEDKKNQKIFREQSKNRQTDRQRTVQKLRPPYPLWSVDRRGSGPINNRGDSTIKEEDEEKKNQIICREQTDKEQTDRQTDREQFKN